MDWKNIKNFDFAGFLGKTFNFLLSKTRWVFLGLAIILTAFCCYLWYFYIYHSEWSEARKQGYVQTKEEGIAFDREKFNKFTQGVDDRQMEFQKDLPVDSDVFRLKN